MSTTKKRTKKNPKTVALRKGAKNKATPEQLDIEMGTEDQREEKQVAQLDAFVAPLPKRAGDWTAADMKSQATTDAHVKAMTSKAQWVNAAQALVWIEDSKRDNVRDRRKPTMERYAATMASGAWRLSGEAIIFDTTGSLIDGWHRLSALIKADLKKPGIEVAFLVVDNAQRSVIAQLDSGNKRTLAQTLAKVENVKNAGAVVAGIKAWSKLFGEERGRELSEHLQREIFAVHRAHFVVAAKTAVAAYDAGLRTIGKGVLTAVIAQQLIKQPNAVARKTVVACWTAYIEGGKQSVRMGPAAELNKMVTEMVRKRETFTQGQQAMLLLRVWNAVATKNPSTKPQLTRGLNDAPSLVNMRKGKEGRIEVV